jgi:hypothetical protein
MPQKKGKKENKKVIKAVIKNVKQPLLKNSINIKIDLDDDNDKKKKPRRKRRQQKETKETTNNAAVSYVDEVGKPISNEYINKSFTGSYMQQPFSRNSTVIGTSFNESAIMEKVMDKMSKLNNTSNMSLNQSTNNTLLNQSVATPQRPRTTPPQLLRPAPRILPRQLSIPRPSPTAIQFSTTPMQFINLEPPQLPQAAPSTIAPASPTVASFNLSAQPEQARSQVGTISEEFISSSSRAAELSKEAMNKIFGNIPTNDIDEILKIICIVDDDKETHDKIIRAKNNAGRSSSFISKFKEIYRGRIGPQTAASKAWAYYRQIKGY